MPEHFSYPSIEQFHNARRNIQKKAQFIGLDENQDPMYDNTAVSPTIKYQGTIKLHGTNSGFVWDGESVYSQSRERIVTPDNDNFGFARFIAELNEEDLNLIKSNFCGKKVAIFGEWVGPGIQKGVAISQISQKSLFVFASKDIETDEWLDIKGWTFPERFYNIYNFPTFEIEIDFENPGVAVNQMNEWVLEVEKECPVAKTFGISGVGEGLVFRPLDSKYSDSKFIFKVKGAAHSQSHVKKLATVDVEKVASVQAFCDKVLDNERLEQQFQKLKEHGKLCDQTSTGDFIRFIIQDVTKECTLEMEASGITEKDLGKTLQLQARRWYFNRIKTA